MSDLLPRAADATSAPPPQWHTLDVDDVLDRVGSTPDGLDPDEIPARRARSGPNVLAPVRSDAWWQVLGRQFASVVVIMLVACAGLTLALGRWIDAIAILVAIGADVVLGFIQEMRAARDVSALRRLQVRHSTVRRRRAALLVPSEEIVPGDLVLLETGDRVPADLRLSAATALMIDESLLTGESAPVRKATAPTPASTPIAEQEGMAWSGTLVISGRGRGIVVATGSRTAVGEIDSLVRSTDTPTPLQRLMRRFESQLGIGVAIVALVVLGGGLRLGLGFGDAFLNAVSLAVAAIPEGLPVVLTVALSIGVSRMARHRAVVRTLPAVEALGSTTVIASDKTGTMTLNRLTVERLWTPDEGMRTPGDAGDAGRDALRIAALSNDAHLHSDSDDLVGDPVDVALARLALSIGAVSPEGFGATRLDHSPYEPERRYSATVTSSGAGRDLLVKGAPDLVLRSSVALAGHDGSAPLDREKVLAAHRELTDHGMRVLAAARRPLAADEDPATAIAGPALLEFVGLIGMADPPRHGVDEAILACTRAGVTVVMLTGDDPRTAAAIGARLGLAGSEEPVTGAELAELPDDRLVSRLRAARIAARVSPRDKLRIVRALEAAGEIVAVTGDGVNDAPALRAASLGVAMGASGTEVAREAADIVLTDDDFGTIVRAVHEGRVTFAAVQKAIVFLISTGLAALVAVVGDLIVGGPLIFLPVQMIWFNLVSNGLQDVGLAFEGADGDELDRPPRAPTAGLLSRRLWLRVAISGVWMGAVVLAGFHLALASGAATDQARTFALTIFAFLNLFQTFNSRSPSRSVFAQAPWSNPFLLVAVASTMALHILAVLTPPGWIALGFAPLTPMQWVLSIGLGATVLLVVEAGKAIERAGDRRRRVDQRTI